MENWKKVHLSKEEEEGVTVEDSEIYEDDIFQRTLVGKIWSERSFNVRAFKQTITQAWRLILKNPVEIQDLNKNLFIFRFTTKKDLENVLKYGPWSFDRNIIILRRISGEEQPSELEMHTVSFWARVYDLPFKLRAESMAKKIGDIIGKYEEMDNKEASCMGGFLRIKVAVDVRQPLKRGTVIRFQGKSLKVGFKYERLPTFCFACGRIGHQLKYCEEDIEEGELQFGPWLRASPLPKEQRKDSSCSGTVGRSLFVSTSSSNSNKNRSQGEKGVVDVEVEQNEKNGNPEKQQQEEASSDKGKEKEKSNKDVERLHATKSLEESMDMALLVKEGGQNFQPANRGGAMRVFFGSKREDGGKGDNGKEEGPTEIKEGNGSKSNWKRLTDAEINERRRKGLCFRCDEKFGPGHVCKNEQLRILMPEGEEEEGSEEEEEIQWKGKAKLASLGAGC